MARHRSLGDERHSGAPIIAIVSRDAELAAHLEEGCRMLGFDTGTHADLAALLTSGHAHDTEVVLVDSAHLDTASSARLEDLLGTNGAPSLLVIAHPERLPESFAWLERGATDVLTRPPHPAELRLRLTRALESREVKIHLQTLEEELTQRSRLSFESRAVVARSPAMRHLEATIERVARMRTTVLVTGESGVGKELVARSLHFRSPRAEGPFVAINCAAMPPDLIESELFGHERGAFTGATSRRAGKFEIADGGTLFLDEVGDTDPATQAKLLRVLEQQEFMRVGGARPIRVDVRLVAATNADLEALVAKGAFREDLYYRLKVVPLVVPPLRERREDIPELVASSLERICRSNRLPPRRLTDRALERLVRYRWPGNVRELLNTLEAIVVATPGELIDVEALPAPIRGDDQSKSQALAPNALAGRSLEDLEHEAIRQTLALVDGSRVRAAEMLGISVRTLRRRIADFALGEESPAKPGRPRVDSSE